MPCGKNHCAIGDSRVRYQFLNLVLFLLSQSSFMICQDHPTRNHTTHDPACTVIEKRNTGKIGIFGIRKVQMCWQPQTNHYMAIELIYINLCDCFCSKNPELTIEN